MPVNRQSEFTTTLQIGILAAYADGKLTPAERYVLMKEVAHSNENLPLRAAQTAIVEALPERQPPRSKLELELEIRGLRPSLSAPARKRAFRLAFKVMHSKGAILPRETLVLLQLMSVLDIEYLFFQQLVHSERTTTSNPIKPQVFSKSSGIQVRGNTLG